MPSLPEVLAGIAAYIGDDPDEAAKNIKELKKALRDTKGEHAEQLNAVAQSLIDVGAGKKKNETDTTVAQKQAEIDRLTEELREAKEAAEAAETKPDERAASLQGQIDRLKEQKKTAEDALKAEREGRKTDRVTYAAKDPLSLLQGAVDPDYLAEVVAPRLQRRVRPTEQGVEYLDEHETPYDGDEKQQAKALAEDTLKSVPDKYRLRPMNAGGGSSNGLGGQTVTAAALEQEKLRSREYTAL